MKNTILSLIAFVFAIGTSTKTLANNNTTLLKETTAINKIEVRGNVELFISDAPADQIKVYNKYYAERALVQSKNGVLRIASYANQKLVVWVSSTDLRSVSVYDNAVVKSFGQLSKIEFNVDLHNNAQAFLNLDAYATNLTVKDKARANMTGSVYEMALNRGIQSSVNSVALVVTRLTESAAPLAIAAE